MFENFLEILEQQGGSVRAYEACAEAARSYMHETPETAAACFVIASAARKFVDSYDDQPLSSVAAKQEYEAFKADIRALGEAYGKGTDSDRLAALNRMAERIAG